MPFAVSHVLSDSAGKTRGRYARSQFASTSAEEEGLERTPQRGCAGSDLHLLIEAAKHSDA